MKSKSELAAARRRKQGEMVKIKIRRGKNFVFKTGRMAFVSPVADPASGLLEMKVEFDNKDGKVRPGVQGYLLLNGR